MSMGIRLFLEALVIDNQREREEYEVTQCGECGRDVQLEQSGGVCWHCHPLYDPPAPIATRGAPYGTRKYDVR